MSPDMMWNFNSTPPLRMSPTSDYYSNSLRMSPSNIIGSSPFIACSPNDLLVAAANGEELNVAILVNLHHIDVHYKDSQGNSALHYATKHGHLKVIEYLVSHGARITDLGHNGMSLLHIASMFNHMHIVHFLISEHKINPCCLDSNKRTPFFVACMYGHLEIAQYLLQILLKHEALKDIINSKDIHDETVIHTACRKNHIEIVRWLMSELNL